MDILPLLYTYQLHGDMARLPRLYTFIRQLTDEAFQTHGVKPLVLDLGEACVPDNWHCAATDGRSMLLALDAMGYHAAQVTGMAEASRLRLKSSVSLGLVDVQHIWRYDVPPVRDEGIIISSIPTPALRLNIHLTPAPHTQLTQGMLTLAPVAAGQVGSVLVDMRHEPTLIHTALHTLPANMRPDATISAAIELIEEEARLLRGS